MKGKYREWIACELISNLEIYLGWALIIFNLYFWLELKNILPIIIGFLYGGYLILLGIKKHKQHLPKDL